MQSGVVMMQQLRLDCIKWAALGAAAWSRCSRRQQRHRHCQQAKILISAQKSQNWQMAKQRGNSSSKKRTKPNANRTTTTEKGQLKHAAKRKVQKMWTLSRTLMKRAHVNTGEHTHIHTHKYISRKGRPQGVARVGYSSCNAKSKGASNCSL